MAHNYTYFPGCCKKGQAIAYYESLDQLFQLLGAGFTELEDWNCCGATSYMSIDEHSAFTLSARNFSLAEKARVEQLLTPCAACYLVLRKTQDYIKKYPEVRADVARSLEAVNLKVVDSVATRHPLEVLYNDFGTELIRSKVVRKWQGGPVACYYGCQAVRPYYEVDKPVDPTRMDELLTAAGIPTVPYSLKTKCCGGSLTGTIHKVGVRLNALLLKEAARKGAKAIVTLCPLCQFNLDLYQKEARKDLRMDLDMPILYFSQLLGWALGADSRALGMQRSVAGQASIKQWFSPTKEVAAHV